MTDGNCIRVLVVDDSIAVRRIVSEALAADPEIHVVGTAANGADALALVGPLRPDVIVLDLEMPVLDGLETLARLKPAHPDVRVIVFSSHGPHAPERTLQALWLGACDYVTKPAASRVQSAIAQVREELVWRIRAFASGEGVQPGAKARPPGAGEIARPPRRDPASPGAQPRATLIAIAASTGGPQALAEVLGALPPTFSAPIVIVQHLPASFTKQLVAGLSRRTPLPVRVAEHGAKLQPAGVWIAPGDRHVLVERQGLYLRLLLSDAPPENACRPSADPLFRSVAEASGARALGVVLTGMGRDGLAGGREIRRQGGELLAQDEATSVVWGMPGSVANEGLANEVLPVKSMGAAIARRVSRNLRPVTGQSEAA